jgi:imidazole glycerol-phosphate synthase subunit HisH
MIGLINYDGGNYKSVSNILEYLDINFLEINHNQDLKKVSHIILPGVGSYNNLVSKLKSKKLFDEILYQIDVKKTLYLGVCVGMQLLSNYGLENVETKGFGLIEGSVEKIPVKNEILPNIGWHNIILENKNSVLFKNIEINEMFFYFVHSYYFKLKNKENCSSRIFYEKKITSSVERDNIFGVQFHPEKSQSGGLKLLKNFCNL